MKLNAKEITNDSQKGGSAYYVQLTKTKGVKVIKSCFLTKEILISSYQYESILKEKEIYDDLHSCGCDFIPKCYGTAILKSKLGFQIGLVLQHLGNVSLNDLNMTYAQWKDIAIEFEEKLFKFGYDNRDVHNDNILLFEGRYWLIDLEPKYVEKI